MNTEHKQATLQHGIECFNRREFFECHEVLEELWLAETPEEKPFYQGLIQVASAFHHFRRGNLRGARSLLERGSEKLRGYPSPYHGVNLASLLAALVPWQEHFNQQQTPADLPLPAIKITK